MASVAKRKWTHNGVTKEAWAVRYFDEKGVRRSKTFDQKKAADTFKRKVEREIEDGTHTPESDTKTIGDGADEYIEWCQTRQEDGRIGQGRLHILETFVRVNVRPHLGSITFKDLATADVDRFYAALAKKYTPLSARKKVQEFKLIEEFAIRRGWTKRTASPAALKELRGIPPVRIRTFTPEQVATLLAEARTPSGTSLYFVRPQALMACCVHLAAFSGLRRGEILGLTLDNLDLERRLIRVRHSLTQWDELKGPKTAAGVRDVPVPAQVCDMLADWIARFYVPNDRQLVFRSASGGLVAVGDFQHRFWGLLRRAGLGSDTDRFHFHALRHFAASWMIHHGLPLTDVAALLGHSKFDMTLQVYAHPVVRPGVQAAAIERMVTQMPALTDARVTQTA